MEFRKLIEERRSVRSYQEGTPDHEVLVQIVKDAQMAPSWKNLQASRTYVIEDPEKLEELRSRALPSFNRRSSANAALIVTTFVKDTVAFTNGVPDNELGNMWGAYDLGLHDAYLILAAKDAGYDTLIMGIRDAQEIRNLLQVPEEEVIVSVIAIGKREKEPSLGKRKELEEAARFVVS